MFKKKLKLDYGIIITVILFAIISIITISSALTYLSPTLGNLALKQAMWYAVGIILVIIIIKLKNKFLYRNAWLFYFVLNLLLLFLLLFAPEINNSKCWFVIPGIGSFQPSEFMKIGLMLVLATMITTFRGKKKSPSLKDEGLFLLKSLLIVIIPSILTFLEPDTGAVIIYFIIYFIMMFASGIRIRWFVILALLIVAVLGFIGGTYFFNEELFINLFGNDLYYRLERIFEWQTGSGLQLENAIASIGSAGLFGHGYNQTPLYFPESGTDFIFAVYASNFGLIGALVLLLLIAFFDGKLIHLATKKINQTDKFVLAGIIGVLIFQQVQNIGMTIGLLPITGITLPFISYGGSSLLSYMIMIGIILNIQVEDDKPYKLS